MNQTSLPRTAPSNTVILSNTSRSLVSPIRIWPGRVHSSRPAGLSLVGGFVARYFALPLMSSPRVYICWAARMIVLLPYLPCGSRSSWVSGNCFITLARTRNARPSRVWKFDSCRRCSTTASMASSTSAASLLPVGRRQDRPSTSSAGLLSRQAAASRSSVR